MISIRDIPNKSRINLFNTVELIKLAQINWIVTKTEWGNPLEFSIDIFSYESNFGIVFNENLRTINVKVECLLQSHKSSQMGLNEIWYGDR